MHVVITTHAQARIRWNVVHVAVYAVVTMRYILVMLTAHVVMTTGYRMVFHR